MTIRRYRNPVLFGLIMGFLTVSQAFATEQGAYLGVAVGNSSFSLDRGDVEDFFVFPENVAIDDSDTGFSLSVGYRFSPYVALEAAYTNFGETTASEVGRYPGL